MNNTTMKVEKIMKKTLKVFLHRSRDSYDNKYKYSVHSWDMSDYGSYIFLLEKEITFELPTEIEMIKKEAKTLEDKIVKIKADTFVECEQLEEKIKSLLCIEDKSRR